MWEYAPPNERESWRVFTVIRSFSLCVLGKEKGFMVAFHEPVLLLGGGISTRLPMFKYQHRGKFLTEKGNCICWYRLCLRAITENSGKSEAHEDL